ncbi:hypothetical protein EB821_06205 [Candidatus Marinimicrobia bacterium PRS2]|nr:hypothetical protein EB821_06205 [Candidatus Marinimicrobia bacterium PRS2]
MKNTNSFIILLLLGLCFSQDFEKVNKTPLQGLTASPNPGKVETFLDFSYLITKTKFDSIGHTQDNLNLKYLKNVLNIKVDYFGKHNSGVYISFPIITNKYINDTLMNEINTDVTLGLYFLYTPLPTNKSIKILRHKTSVFLRGNDSLSFGISLASDFMFSEKLIISTHPSLLFTESGGIDIKTRAVYNLMPSLSLGLELQYFAGAYETFDNNSIERETAELGSMVAIRPMLGYQLLSNVHSGYLNIERCNLLASWDYAFQGETIYQKNNFQCGIQIYFN